MKNMRTSMTEAEIESYIDQVEDAPGYPTYSEQQLDGKFRRDWKPSRGLLTITAHQREELDYMTSIDFKKMAQLARLTDNQATILELFMQGNSGIDIAEALDCTKQYVYATIKRTSEKILQAWQTYPFYGLWEVYMELIHRTRK